MFLVSVCACFPVGIVAPIVCVGDGALELLCSCLFVGMLVYMQGVSAE